MINIDKAPGPGSPEFTAGVEKAKFDATVTRMEAERVAQEKLTEAEAAAKEGEKEKAEALREEALEAAEVARTATKIIDAEPGSVARNVISAPIDAINIAADAGVKTVETGKAANDYFDKKIAENRKKFQRGAVVAGATGLVLFTPAAYALKAVLGINKALGDPWGKLLDEFDPFNLRGADKGKGKKEKK
ncbi:MAG: hypothetical protein ABIA47_02490 [bacterium]